MTKVHDLHTVIDEGCLLLLHGLVNSENKFRTEVLAVSRYLL